MWIIPKELSAYAQDTVESNSDLNLLASMCERSLMWRSKPSQSTTWLKRWKQNKWIQHLFSLMLKPFLTDSFIERYTASLEDIPVSHSAVQENGLEKKTQGISGPTSQMELFSANRTGYFSRMLRDISLRGSYKSSPIWKKWVTGLRSEYYQRKKLAHRTGESECLSWATPNAGDPKAGMSTGRKQKSLGQDVAMFNGQPDPDSDNTTGNRQEFANNWPTITAHDTAQRKDIYKQGGTPLSYAALNWPTPDTQNHRDGSVRRKDDNLDQGGNHSVSLHHKCKGKLNPRWVETLMGLPENWVKPDEESSNRIDELRMLGNGVVPQTAAKAFVTLITKEAT